MTFLAGCRIYSRKNLKRERSRNTAKITTYRSGNDQDRWRDDLLRFAAPVTCAISWQAAWRPASAQPGSTVTISGWRNFITVYYRRPPVAGVDALLLHLFAPVPVSVAHSNAVVSGVITFSYALLHISPAAATDAVYALAERQVGFVTSHRSSVTARRDIDTMSLVTAVASGSIAFVVITDRSQSLCVTRQQNQR